MTTSAILPEQARSDNSLVAQFRAVRNQTVTLCAPLQVEDFVVSTMPDVSPTKWHLAHTSWFFETFVLADHLPGLHAARIHATRSCSTRTTSRQVNVIAARSADWSRVLRSAKSSSTAPCRLKPMVRLFERDR